MDRLRLRGILDQARLSLMQVFKPTADDKEWPAFAKTHSPTKLINTPEYQSSAWSDLGLEHLAFLYDDTNQYRSRSTEVAYNFADPPFMQAVETIHIEEDRNIMTQLLNILQHSSGLNHQ
ncbi:hypothetical protein CALVIDRAFT_538775 [Calocera viscosa TUFC12733]|uniref:Uncharacterized protein n=1 Tax=Calocera viscosa (strain TUFC12733) TaxID=1330018 RepID=A0A167KHG2_CALVF|nr:hypothetical protein CALVIDRAFT_538775 [Calocera viscosa TUFC12733]